MIISQDNLTRMINDIIKKANNNGDLEALICPSDYGFGRKNEDTQAAKDFLLNQSEIKEVKIHGKDLLLIRIIKQ